MSLRPRGVIQPSSSSRERNRGRIFTTRSVRWWVRWMSRFQYVGLPVVDERGWGGQALVSRGRVGNEHDVVLSPSDRGQKVGKIAIAGDEDDCCWSWVVLNKRHDIHCVRYQSCTVVSCTVKTTHRSSSSQRSSFHCVGSLGREVSAGQERWSRQTGERQATGLKFRSEG
jgi:hypothetical protein